MISGASGSGKSSLVLAGVLPHLVAELGAEELRIVPGLTPSETLHGALARRTRPDAPCLLVVDQLEELFTLLPPERADERQAFARELWRLVSDPAPPLLERQGPRHPLPDGVGRPAPVRPRRRLHGGARPRT